MGYFTKKIDKKSGDGLALTEWNDLNNAVAGNAGLTLALNAADKIGIGTSSPENKLSVQGNVSVGGAGPDSAFNLLVSGKVGIGATSALAPLSIASSGKESGPDDSMHITNNCILFGGNNKGKEANSAQISAGKHAPNSLNIIGMSSGASSADRRVDIWAEGGMKVNGSVTASQFIGDGSKLTNLTVGAMGVNLATEPGAKVGIGTTTPQAPLSIATADGKESNPDNALHLTNDCILFGGNNNGRQADSAQISAGRHVANSLNIVGMSTGTDGTTRKVEVWAEGGLKVNGPMQVNNGTFQVTKNNNTCSMYPVAQTQTNQGAGLVFEITTSNHGPNKQIIWNGDNNWDSLSDRKLKSHVNNEEDILNRLMALDVKNYCWNGEPERKIKMIGFIAQDVQPLFPALVGAVEDEETKETTMTLNYASFGVLAVGAIKELKLQQDKRIATLEEEIKVLKELYAGLMSREVGLV
jgi:hypothetical protein